MLHDGMKEYEIGIVRAAQVKCNFKLRKSKLRLVETVRFELYAPFTSNLIPRVLEKFTRRSSAAGKCKSKEVNHP